QGHCENAFYVPAGNTKLGLIDTGDIGLSKSNYKQHLLPVFLWHPPSFGWLFRHLVCRKNACQECAYRVPHKVKILQTNTTVNRVLLLCLLRMKSISNRRPRTSS